MDRKYVSIVVTCITPLLYKDFFRLNIYIAKINFTRGKFYATYLNFTREVRLRFIRLGRAVLLIIVITRVFALECS